jgi:hypothetical protein
VKTRVSILVATIVVACLAWIGTQTTPAQPKEVKGPAVSKWEYKRAESPSDAALNKLGEEGWELVTAVGDYPYSFSGGSNPSGRSGFTKVMYIFKRPKR